MSQIKERKYPRSNVNLNGKFHCIFNRGDSIDLKVKTISEGGAKITTDKVDVGKIMYLEVEMDYQPMTVPARVVWKGAGECGVQFVPVGK